MKSYRLGLFGWVGLAAFPAHAHAQDMTSPAQTDDQIVVTGRRAVTATKTDTSIAETPQAISVVPDELYRDRGARNVQETLRYSAGVTAEAFGLDTRSDTIVIRGLSPTQYKDGMRAVYNFSPIPREDVNFLDRVEVLRGPASVLYGQNANGGIVNIVSKRPNFTAAGRVSLEYGSYDRKQGVIDITGPLDAAGTLAGRIVAVLRDAHQQTDRIADDRVALAPSLTWRPGADTTITAIGLFQRDRSASSQQFLPLAATILAPSHGRRIDNSTFLGDVDFDRLEARQYSGTLLAEHRFSDLATLRSSVRYVDARSTFQEIFPDVYSDPLDPFIDGGADIGRIVNRNFYQIKPRIRTLTNDNNLQLDFATGPFEHRMLIGADYSDFRQRSRSGFGQVSPIDIYDPVSTGVVQPDYAADPNQRNTQLGIYVQDQISYADRVTLVVGARRDRARSKTAGLAEQVDKATTFKAGLIGDIGYGISPYVSYSEAFLPLAGLDFNNVAFVPTRGRQYEAGVKWQPMPAALVTANVFDIVESNRPTNDPLNVLNTVQTGKVASSGFEIEAAVAVADDVQLTAAYSYTDAKGTESNFAPEVGQRLSDVPRHLASVWGVKTLALGNATDLRIGAGVRYVGATFSTGTALTLRTPGYTLADALVAVDWDRWSLAVNATNLFDKQYYRALPRVRRLLHRQRPQRHRHAGLQLLTMKRGTVRAWYVVHKWTSLVCTLFLLMLCLTGLPLIFGEEIHHASGPETEVASPAPGARPADLDGFIAKAVTLYPGDVPLFLGWDPDHPTIYVNTGARPDTPPAEMHTAIFHAFTGEQIPAPQFNEGVMYFLFQLHTEMFAGLPGKLFLGLMGLLFAIAIVSGVVLYAPFMRKLDFGTVRTARSRRLKWLDLHNLLGIVTAMWAGVVGLTGVLNTLEKPLYQSWQDGQLARMTAPYQGLPPPERLGSIDAAVKAARAAVPGMRPAFVSYPGTGYSGFHHYGVFMQGDSPLSKRTYQPVLVDAATSRFTATAEWPAFMQALYLSQPLHFGDYGGLPLKILWALLTLVTITMLGSGLYLWLGRHRRPIDALVVEIESGGVVDVETGRPPYAI